jgi:hypothetical protein
MVRDIDTMDDSEHRERLLAQWLEESEEIWDARARTGILYGDDPNKWPYTGVAPFPLIGDRIELLPRRDPPYEYPFWCRACYEWFTTKMDATVHEGVHISTWHIEHLSFRPHLERNRDDALVLGDALSLACATLAGLGSAQ